MKKVLKILGILIGAIVLLLLGGAAFIHFGGIPGYEVQAPALTVDPDSARIAEGRRLATMVCNDCHMSPEGKLEGGLMRDMPKEFGTAWAANITKDPTYGSGRYTDGELAYLLRTGIKRDGKYAPPWMPKFPHLSDEDMYSIIAYLRSDHPDVAPSQKVQPSPQPSFLVKLLCRTAFKPLPYPTAPVVAPDPADKVAFGRYLSTGKVECYSCHSADFKTVNIMEPEKSAGFFGGGNVFVGEDGKVIYSANLTPDKETGLGAWTEEQFTEAVRFAKHPSGKGLRYPMKPFTALTDQEISAIWAYLQTVPPIRHEVERNW